MSDTSDISSLTLNRLSLYLRCLRELQELGVEKVSSQDFAQRFHLSSSQIRKDLAQFGEFGIRGVGYDVESLAGRLYSLLGLNTRHRLVIVGMGHLGSALAGYVGFNDGSFQVVAAVDNDKSKVGKTIGNLAISHSRHLARVVHETGAEIGILTVPAAAAQESFEALARAGVRSVLNFAPVHLKENPKVRLKNVDLRVYVEEIAFLLGDHG